MKISTLPTAIAALLSMAMVGQASAYTSAGSKIEYRNLDIAIFNANTPADEITFLPGVITNFNFVTTNTTTLNGTTIADSSTCAGIPAGNTCAPAPPRLNTPLQLLGVSGHTENDFNLDGPSSVNSYSYSDSAIQTAQLAGDAATSAGIIAETAIVDNGDGNSSATIQSTTGFEFSFTIVNPGPYSLVLNFEANPQSYSASENPGAILALAESSVAAETTLTQDGGLGNAQWNPDGAATGCTSLAGGVTCNAVTELDPESLNEKTGITSDPNIDVFSTADVFNLYNIEFQNLTAGNWTFTLTTTVANSVTKRVAVPEPGALLLIATGLIGVGAMRRRRQQA